MPNPTEYSSPILFDDDALFIPKILAVIYGYEKAHFIQQAHHWVRQARKRKGGKIDANNRPWFWRSIAQFEAEFYSLFKRSSINKYRRDLVAEGILLQQEEVSASFPGGSRTWYSLDYEKLNAIYAEYEANEGVPFDDIPPSEGMSQNDNGDVTARQTFTESTTEKTDRENNSGFAASAAAKTGLPAALPSTLSSVPPRKRSEEKRVKSEEQSQTRIPLDDLTPLGKEIIALCGKGTALAVKPFLTQAQADKLSEEHSVPYKGKNYLITPDDLYASDDLYRAWIETEVYSTLRAQGGDKPLAKDKFISAVTMGSTVLNLSEFLAWREQQIDKQEMVSALTDPAKVGEGRFSMLEEYEKMIQDDEEEGDESE